MQYLLFIERKNSKQAFGCLSENWNKCSGEPGGASGPVALNWSCFKLLFRWSDSLRQGSFLFRAFISPIIVIQTMSILVSSFYFANHSQRSPPGFTPRAPYWGTFAIISIFYISRGFCRRCKSWIHTWNTWNSGCLWLGATLLTAPNQFQAKYSKLLSFFDKIRNCLIPFQYNPKPPNTWKWWFLWLGASLLTAPNQFQAKSSKLLRFFGKIASIGFQPAPNLKPPDTWKRRVFMTRSNSV